MFGCGGHLGRRAEPPDIFLEENHPMTISSTFSSYWANGFSKRSEMSDTILEGDHPRIISAKFGWDWLSSFRFFLNFIPPFFLICIIGQNRQKFKVHKKSCNTCFLTCITGFSLLCLYSSNLGSFWLKIEQFWPFEEISIFSNGGHLGYRTVLMDTILKGDTT